MLMPLFSKIGEIFGRACRPQRVLRLRPRFRSSRLAVTCSRPGRFSAVRRPIGPAYRSSRAKHIYRSASISRLPLPSILSDPDKAAVFDRHVRPDPRIARTIQHPAITDDKVIYRCVRLGCDLPRRSSEQQKENKHRAKKASYVIVHRFISRFSS